jgi:small subunit ribosomal protein S9
MATAGERYFYGTGRRKTAVARVRLYPGSGEILINGKGYLTVFTRGSHQAAVLAPLKAAAADQRFNVQAKVAGGGITGWAGAVSHGIARALAVSDENLKPALRRQSLLTRDWASGLTVCQSLRCSNARRLRRAFSLYGTPATGT